MNVCSNLKRVLFYCLTVHKLDVNNNLNSLAPPLFLSIICPIHTTPSLMSSIYDWWRSVSFWICSVCFILWLHLTIAIIVLVNCYWRNICSAFLFGIGSLLCFLSLSNVVRIQVVVVLDFFFGPTSSFDHIISIAFGRGFYYWWSHAPIGKGPCS